MLESSGERTENTNDCSNSLEDDCTSTMVTESIEDLCSGENVETDKEDIVKQEHNSSSFKSNFRYSREKNRSDVTDISSLRMSHAKLPKHITCVPSDKTQAKRDKCTTYPSKNTPTPGKGKDGQTDILAEKENSSFLPT